MITLAIDSSSCAASCALMQNGRLMAASLLDVGLTHSQTLLPMIDAMLKGATLSMEEIDVLAVAVGPGSFTGVRIGVATAKGLAFPHETRCMPVSTLLALAHSVEIPAEATICASLDARRGQVYAAIFHVKDGCVRRLTEDIAASAEELVSRLNDCDTPVLLVGDGTPLLQTLLPNQCATLNMVNNAVGIARVAHALEMPSIHPDALQPIYLRLPQAERERLGREATPKGEHT